MGSGGLISGGAHLLFNDKNTSRSRKARNALSLRLVWSKRRLSVAQNVGDHIGGGVQVADPVSAIAVTATVLSDAAKKVLERRSRRAAEGGR